MKDYKRLTDRVIAEMLRNTEGESWDSDNIEAQCYIRLAELEDKIEVGTLVEVPKGAVVLTPEERDEEMRLCNEERKQAVKELEAENAELRATLSKMETVEKELRERLEKAVELPSVKRDCELTQIVYRNNYGNIEEETYFHDCYYGQGHDVRGDVYAEARLEELKGGSK